VGESLQIVVMEDGDDALAAMSPARRDQLGRTALPYTVLVNPVVEPVGEDAEEFFEGCLSLTGYSALVRRWRAVRVRALDQRGEPIDLRLEGWPARIAQHEADHLAGVLYVDRMDTRSLTTFANLGRHWKARPAAEVRAALAPPPTARLTPPTAGQGPGSSTPPTGPD
jgi:peptide deformylase